MGKYLLGLVGLLSVLSLPLRAADLTGGVMFAVPTPGGKPPVIDGDLSDWDLTAAEPIWIAPDTAKQMHGRIALMYDDEALYYAATVAQPGRPIHNTNTPLDPFWNGDMTELRLVADPALAYPADPNAKDAATSTRIAHISFWKNSETNLDYMGIGYGLHLKAGTAVNPHGSQIVIKADGNKSYVIEAKIAWSALNSPDGRNPFKPGARMTATLSIHWGGENQTPALYRVNPGTFAFQHAETWGQVEFSANGNLKARHGTMEESLAVNTAPPVGAPIDVDVPDDNLKLSVNILGPNGEVIRELAGGEPRAKGKATVYFDGHDQWGAPLSPGDYHWGAYLSPGLKAQYVGTVGTSGNPGYETEDGKGLFGGDHGAPISVAADGSGLYFLWISAESGRAVVKTDYDGNVTWRKTPFVGGGFGPFFAIASNGKYAFVTYEAAEVNLARLDASTGRIAPFGSVSSVSIAKATPAKIPEDAAPTLVRQAKTHSTDKADAQPEAAAIAASTTEVFVPQYSQNIVHVIDSETGKESRTLNVAGPRGVALNAKGDLFVVSYVPQKTASVMVFRGGQGTPQTVVASGLESPWAVAVDGDGNLHVTDDGNSQQVKSFASDGKLQQTLGKAGGRPWVGAYDSSSFLHPAGIAVDEKGGLLVAEASLPKVMSRLDIKTGQLIKRWFGAIAYAGQDVPDATDPQTIYYPVSSPDGELRHETGGGICRAHLPGGDPDAYWFLPRAGIADVGDMSDAFGSPVVFVGTNGKKYMFGDSGHGIVRIEGDQLVAVGHVIAKDAGLEVWSDSNSDGRLQADELQMIQNVEGQAIGRVGNSAGSMWMQPNGDVYLMTAGNRILKIPATEFTSDGGIRWNASKASWAVPVVLASLKGGMGIAPRAGLIGARIDIDGNLYTCFNTKAPYATKELTDAMIEGLGHSAECNAVKFAKYAPDGHLLWMAGRKATAAARPGEMYHFWVMAGLVGDKYIAGHSEWGQIYFYTHDGFFVDAIMNNPGLAPPAGPYTFGSETFGGRVNDFPDRNEVWAYSCGMAYRVLGFDHGKVIGERRASGTVHLDKVYEPSSTVAVKAAPIQIVELKTAPQGEAAWPDVPPSTVNKDGKPMASVQVGYDKQFLYLRAHIVDDTPLVNSADTITTAFHNGDALGLDLGPVGSHDKPVLGDIRLLAAQVGGKPHLIAMKPLTRLEKRPDHYYTPAGGDRQFQFVGDVPGGSVTLTADVDGHGYTAAFAVPRSFIEVPTETGSTLSADVEIMLSGQAARGVQTVSRNYLFAPQNSTTTMIDDIPTEAWLYPQHWGSAQVK